MAEKVAEEEAGKEKEKKAEKEAEGRRIIRCLSIPLTQGKLALYSSLYMVCL